ncbi:hypothetical protein TRIP_C50011 [Candidatus Zixiibacteriota bacterium]|nr:hypothetical protein TRIP_C50011 [candidate division Zixibacteria bacterium]
MSGLPGSIRALAWNGSEIAAVFLSYSDTMYSVASSIDGENWLTKGTFTQPQAEARIDAIIWAGSFWLLSSAKSIGTSPPRIDSLFIWTSSDLSTWNLRYSDSGGYISDFAFSGTRYIGIGQGMVESINGYDWQRGNLSDIEENGVIWTGQRFITTSYNGSGAYASSEGLTWSKFDNDNIYIRGLLFDGQRVIGVGPDGIFIGEP